MPRSSRPPILDDDVRAVVESAHLVFAATVTPDGQPNLSPKGTIRVWDDNRLFFLDIASPKTRANLEQNPKIELNVVEHLSRRGYRFFGTATLHRYDDVFREAGEVAKRFRYTFDSIDDKFRQDLRRSPLRRKTLFYSLFATEDHRDGNKCPREPLARVLSVHHSTRSNLSTTQPAPSSTSKWMMLLTYRW